MNILIPCLWVMNKILFLVSGFFIIIISGCKKKRQPFLKVKKSTIALLILFHRSLWTGNKLKYTMKKAISIYFLILLIYACSKTDDRQKELLKCDCSAYLAPSEPVTCSGTLCQSDTCQTYFSIWKELLLSRNQMSQDYFNSHITPCNTSIDKWNDGITFRISYKVKIEWAEVLLGDQFIIWLSPSTSGLYLPIE